MSFLPASIESHLLNAGCTSTEVLVLRHILHGPAFTLRELAAKTGKSTGVLDQATKKLMGKKILCREQVNGTSKYALASADAVLRWLREHTAETLGLLRRREDDVQKFLCAVEQEQRRPSLEYYEGEIGMERAYWQLLDAASQALHVFLPIKQKEEQDPLADVRSRFHAERNRRKIGCRIIAHDTPLGRRFQSRDVFEARETILITPEVHPLAFEQVVAGDLVGCFSYEEGRASLLRFPHFAEQQIALFEKLWSAPNQPMAEVSFDSISIADIERCGCPA